MVLISHMVTADSNTVDHSIKEKSRGTHNSNTWPITKHTWRVDTLTTCTIISLPYATYTHTYMR